MDVYQVRQKYHSSCETGATLIELIVTIVVIATIAAVTAGIVVSMVQLFVFLPREARTRMIASEITNLMIEGDPGRRGMRYASVVVNADSGSFTYTAGYPASIDKMNVRFRLDSNSIKRSYTAPGGSSYGTEEVIPYYARGDISVSGPASNPTTVFSYYKADGSGWSAPDGGSAIRRVDITLRVKTGAGSVESSEGSFTTTAGVDIKQYY